MRWLCGGCNVWLGHLATPRRNTVPSGGLRCSLVTPAAQRLMNCSPATYIFTHPEASLLMQNKSLSKNLLNYLRKKKKETNCILKQHQDLIFFPILC